MLYSPCLGASPLARENVGGRACPVRPVISALRVFGVFGAPGRFFSNAERGTRNAEKGFLKLSNAERGTRNAEKGFLKLACSLVAVSLLSGCGAVAEFARGYDRELVAGNRGGKNFVEYRLRRNAERGTRNAEREKELVAMVEQLIDELNAERMPQP
jgi:hypothetical protein